MQRLEVSGAVRPIYGLLGVKRLKNPVVSGRRKIIRCMFSFIYRHRNSFTINRDARNIFLEDFRRIERIVMVQI